MKRIITLALLASGPAMGQNAMGAHPDTRPDRSHCSSTSTPTCDDERRHPLPARWWTDQDKQTERCFHFEDSPDRDRKIDECLAKVRRAQ